MLCLDKILRYRLNHVDWIIKSQVSGGGKSGKSMKSIPLWNFDKVPNMIHFRVNIWSKSMLSVTSSKKKHDFYHRIY